MPKEEFQKHIDSVVRSKEEKPRHLHDEAKLHFVEIQNHHYDFTRRFAQAEIVRKCTVEDVLEMFDTLILGDTTARKYAVYVLGSAAGEDSEAVDTDTLRFDEIAEFKARQFMYPAYV